MFCVPYQLATLEYHGEWTSTKVLEKKKSREPFNNYITSIFVWSDRQVKSLHASSDLLQYVFDY